MPKITTIIDGFDTQRLYLYELRTDVIVSNKMFFNNDTLVDILKEYKDRYEVMGNGYLTKKDDLGNISHEEKIIIGWVNKPSVIQ